MMRNQLVSIVVSWFLKKIYVKLTSLSITALTEIASFITRSSCVLYRRKN